MKFKVLLFILLITYLGACKSAQQSSLSKKKRKEWEDKKEAFIEKISNMTPEEFKEMQERGSSIESENADLQSHESGLQSTLSDKDAQALYGSEGGEKGASLQMSGWKWDNIPRPNDQSDESGRIVYQIKVDDRGEIIAVRTLERTVSPSVEAVYRRAVEQLNFSKTADNVDPPAVSTGQITFILKSSSVQSTLSDKDEQPLYGSEGGEKSTSLQMAGWKWDAIPRPNDQSDETGRIVYQIKVDERGEIIAVRTLERTVSPSVEAVYRRAVEQLTFSRTANNVDPPAVSTGKITFILKSK